MFTEASTSTILLPDGKTNALQWNSDGYYLFGEDDWEDIEIEATMIYQGGVIGLIPRFYSPYVYLYFAIGKVVVSDKEESIHQETHRAELAIYNDGDMIRLGSKEISPLTEGQKYRLKAVVTRQNYRLLINDTLVFNIEYGGQSRGNAGVCATAGNRCISIEAKSHFPDGWTSNVESINKAIANVHESEDEDTYFHLWNPKEAKEDLWLKQTISVDEAELILYAEYKGECKVVIAQINGSQSGATTEVAVEAADKWSVIEKEVVVANDCTQISVAFHVSPGKEASINHVQLEPGKYATSYVHNDSTSDVASREASYLTFPAKEIIKPQEGSISVWIQPNVTYDTNLNESFIIIQYTDGTSGISIYGENGKLYAKHGETMVSFVGTPLPLIKGKWYHIAFTWDIDGVNLYVNNNKVSSKVASLFNGTSEKINVGFDELGTYSVFNGLMDDLIIFKTKLRDIDITDIYSATEPIEDNGSMTLRATFNHAIGNFNKTYVEIPNAPEYGSPIIVEKEDGTVLRKVSFVDYFTGQYRTWNEEIVIYDGDDYVLVSFDRLDTENFKVSVMDKDGSYIGDPYRVEGRRIYLTLTDEEKLKYKGMPLHVRYQLEDSFTVDFNIDAPDSFRVDVAKHDGQPLKVIYEGNRFSQEKLADMVEMNPLLNPNHQGFLYVTKTVLPIADFKVKITPPNLPADGVSEGLVIVEPVDMNGNPVFGAKLSVSATEGFLFPSFEPGAARLRDIAGRYIYRYRAPRLIVAQKGTTEIKDRIRIKDTETQLGVEKYILLNLHEEYGVIQTSNSEMDARLVNDTIAAYVFDTLMDYMYHHVNELPDGLEFLDMNRDGFINIEDIEWLRSKVGTTDLWEIQQKILQWRATHKNQRGELK